MPTSTLTEDRTDLLPSEGAMVGVQAEAVELELDDEGEQAFKRLAKSLLPLAGVYSQLGKRLAPLGEDFLVVGEDVDYAKTEELDAALVASDLRVLSTKVEDPDTRDRLSKAALSLEQVATSQLKAEGKTLITLAVEGLESSNLIELLEHIAKTAAIGHSFSVVVDPGDPDYEKSFGIDGDGPFRLEVRKGDLTTGDLATQGGLRSPAPAQDLSPRFTVEREEVDGDTYRVRDTNTDKVVGSGLSQEKATALASRRNATLRKALGVKAGVFIRVPEDLASQLPSLGDRDSSPHHATMLFVGEVEPAEFQAVVEAVQEVAKGLETFKVELTDLGYFKNPKGESIAHLIPRAHGDTSMVEINRALRDAMLERDLEPKQHPGPFKPHVTLAYLKEEEEFSEELPELEFDVTHLEIWTEDGSEHGKISIALGTGEQQSLTKQEVEKSYRVELIKAEDDDEDEHTVFGIVLEPEEVDTQGDIYSEEEIRKTAYRFMERYQTFGLQHEEMVPEILPLESYVAPVDMVIEGRSIKKGTWLLRVRVLDADIWADVKSGKLTGFSIGGSAIRTPELLRLAA